MQISMVILPLQSFFLSLSSCIAHAVCLYFHSGIIKAYCLHCCSSIKMIHCLAGRLFHFMILLLQRLCLAVDPLEEFIPT